MAYRAERARSDQQSIAIAVSANPLELKKMAGAFAFLTQPLLAAADFLQILAPVWGARRCPQSRKQTQVGHIRLAVEQEVPPASVAPGGPERGSCAGQLASAGRDAHGNQPKAPSAAPAAVSPTADTAGPAAIGPHAKASTAQPASTGQSTSDLHLLAMDSGTQFMAAPTTFLAVLCAADGPKREAAPDSSAAEAAAKGSIINRRPHGRVLLLLSELATLIKGDAGVTQPRRWKYAALAGAAVIALAVTVYVWNAPERAFKDAVERNDYARAATLAAATARQIPR